MRTTQRKGDTAAAAALSTFTRMGFDVSVPFTESAPYDLIVDASGTLARVQVKYCGSPRNEVGLRQISSNSKGFNVKKYQQNSFDWLYVLRADGQEFLFTDDLSGRSSIIAGRDEHKIDIVLGGLAERTNALVLKTREGETSGGSNPSPTSHVAVLQRQRDHVEGVDSGGSNPLGDTRVSSLA